MKSLCDDLYPEAATVRVVLDNLNTHTAGALYETFPPEEARRLAAAGVPLHAEARVVAEHGRVRAERAGPAVPESPHPGRGDAGGRGPSLAGRP